MKSSIYISYSPLVYVHRFRTVVLIRRFLLDVANNISLLSFLLGVSRPKEECVIFFRKLETLNKGQLFLLLRFFSSKALSDIVSFKIKFVSLDTMITFYQNFVNNILKTFCNSLLIKTKTSLHSDRLQ